MTERTKNELYPTLKVGAVEDGENAIQLTDTIQGIIKDVKDVTTKHGDKIIVAFESGEDIFNIFLNVQSQNALIDAFGSNDRAWIGKICNVGVKQSPPPFNKQKMIFFEPIA